ncbi:hypothetical protein [Micromonospora lupini]
MLTPHLDPAATVELGRFVAAEYATQPVFPEVEDLFSACRFYAPPEAGC